MGHWQPGRKHGVEFAGGHALPHDPGGDGLQLHVVAEFLFDDFGRHVGGRDAVGPTVNVTDVQGLFFCAGESGTHRKHQSGTCA
ncbi:hypothetical protein D3C72_1199300 [compost metagenome]